MCDQMQLFYGMRPELSPQVFELAHFGFLVSSHDTVLVTASVCILDPKGSSSKIPFFLAEEKR